MFKIEYDVVIHYNIKHEIYSLLSLVDNLLGLILFKCEIAINFKNECWRILWQHEQVHFTHTHTHTHIYIYIYIYIYI